MKEKFRTISTSRLADLVFQSAAQIIDVRSSDAYNGWKENNEARRGHIRGARSLPVKWTKYIDWIETIKKKNFNPRQLTVVYGAHPEEIEWVATGLTKAGFSDLYVYYDFVGEWTRNATLPIDKLPGFKSLVGPEWLKMLLDGGKPDLSDKKKFVLCHAHYRNRDDYDKGHIPGAINLDTLMLESPETWNRRSPRELKSTLEGLGITKDTLVILYGRFSFPKNEDPFPGSSAGHLGAIRCAFIMMYAGVKDVRILNGGLQSWEDEGLATTSKESYPTPVTEFGCEIPANPNLAVDVPEAKQLIASDRGELVCVRSWPEYIGEVSGYNYIEKKGRIPGAVFVNCGSDAYHMENYRNLDHTTREFHEIEQQWKEVGLSKDKRLAFYCGTGWRGSEAFFNAWLLGWPDVAVFDGGWFEWSNDPENPVESGLPEKL